MEAELVWKAFSLEQVNLPEDGDADALWSTASERRGLLPLAASKWTEIREPERFEAVRLAFFDARHVDRRKIGLPEVTAEVLSESGLDGEVIVRELLEDPKWLEAARSDHEEAAELSVFGVPTFAFPGCQPAFLRFVESPEGEEAARRWDRFVELVHDPVFNEFKRAY